MKYEDIIKMVKEVAKLGLSSFEYTEDNIHISMNFPQGQVQETAPKACIPEQTASVTETDRKEETGDIVKSPLVGTFYAAPSENSAPFVKKGDQVKKGQILGIVEAMKLMNEIECEYDGIVEDILVKNAQAVEYGQPLFRIA